MITFVLAVNGFESVLLCALVALLVNRRNRR